MLNLHSSAPASLVWNFPDTPDVRRCLDLVTSLERALFAAYDLRTTDSALLGMMVEDRVRVGLEQAYKAIVAVLFNDQDALFRGHKVLANLGDASFFDVRALLESVRDKPS